MSAASVRRYAPAEPMHPQSMPIVSQRRIRLKDVLALVPLSSSTIYARMKAGTFPKSQNLGGGVVCWRESDILEWLDALPETV